MITNQKDFAMGALFGVAVVAVAVGCGKLYDYIASGNAKEDITDKYTDVIEANLTRACNSVDFAELYNDEGVLNDRIKTALARAISLYVLTTDLSERQARKHLPFLDDIEDNATLLELAKVSKRIIGVLYTERQENPELEVTTDYVLSKFE